MSDPTGPSPLDLAAAYALGALEADEARAFEALLARSPEARREVAEFREVAALLAAGAGTGTMPSAALRERVMAERPAPPAPEGIRTIRIAPTPAARRPWLTVALLTGLAASIALLVLGNQRRATLDAAVSARDSALVQARAALAEREATLAALLAPGVRIYDLASSAGQVPGAQLFLNQAQHTAVLHAFRLPQAPAGRAYQLWFIQDGKPVPSVTFIPDAAGRALVQQVAVPAAGAISAAAITEEPEGGSLAPTTPILLVTPLPAS